MLCFSRNLDISHICICVWWHAKFITDVYVQICTYNCKRYGIQRNVRHNRYLKIVRGNPVPKDGKGREVRRREEIDGHDCLVYTKGVAMLYATIHFYLT